MDDGGQWFIKRSATPLSTPGSSSTGSTGTTTTTTGWTTCGPTTAPTTTGFFVSGHVAVRYAHRGHRWTWGGLDFGALGGAHSVDQRHRLPMCRGGRKRRSPPPTSTGASTVDRSTCCSPTTPDGLPGRCSDGRTGAPLHRSPAHRSQPASGGASSSGDDPGVVAHGHYHLRYAASPTGDVHWTRTTDRDTTAGFSSTPATSTLQLFDHPYTRRSSTNGLSRSRS